MTFQPSIPAEINLTAVTRYASAAPPSDGITFVVAK